MSLQRKNTFIPRIWDINGSLRVVGHPVTSEHSRRAPPNYSPRRVTCVVASGICCKNLLISSTWNSLWSDHHFQSGSGLAPGVIGDVSKNRFDIVHNNCLRYFSSIRKIMCLIWVIMLRNCLKIELSIKNSLTWRNRGAVFCYETSEHGEGRNNYWCSFTEDDQRGRQVTDNQQSRSTLSLTDCLPPPSFSTAD